MRGEEHGRVARQHLRPAMGQLAFLERRQGLRRTALARHAPQARRVGQGGDDGAVLAPAATARVAHVGKDDGRPALASARSSVCRQQRTQSTDHRARRTAGLRLPCRAAPCCLRSSTRRVASIAWPSAPGRGDHEPRAVRRERQHAERAAREPRPGDRDRSVTSGRSTGWGRRRTADRPIPAPRPALPPPPREPMSSMIVVAGCGPVDGIDDRTRIADGAKPPRRILLETERQETARRCRHARPIGLLRQHRRDRVGHRLLREARLPGQHLVENDAERPDVAALVDGLASRLLGRHVGDGAEDHSRLGRAGQGRAVHRGGRRRSERLRQAEVQHLDGAIGS